MCCTQGHGADEARQEKCRLSLNGYNGGPYIIVQFVIRVLTTLHKFPPIVGTGIWASFQVLPLFANSGGCGSRMKRRAPQHVNNSTASTGGALGTSVSCCTPTTATGFHVFVSCGDVLQRESVWLSQVPSC